MVSKRVLALTLLVLGVLFVDDVQTSLATHDLAVRSALFNRSSYFHCWVYFVLFCFSLVME